MWDWRGKIGEWFLEGEKRVEKVGRKYGILGYDKVGRAAGSEVGQEIHEEQEGIADDAHQLAVHAQGSGAAEKVANAISAYVLVKVSASLVGLGLLIGKNNVDEEI